MNIKKKNIFSILFYILFGVSLYFYSIHEDNKRKQTQEIEKHEYPPIGNTKKDYQGYVSNISPSEVFADYTLDIELSNGDKFAIYGSSENLMYKKKDLQENVKVGDSICYYHQTSEFLIFRGKDRFYFKFLNSIKSP